jgi:hypothetical protein
MSAEKRASTLRPHWRKRHDGIERAVLMSWTVVDREEFKRLKAAARARDRSVSDLLHDVFADGVEAAIREVDE